jgi:hypothetical protein
MALVEVKQVIDVDIAHSVSVSKHEWLVIHERLYPFHPSACHGIFPSINQADLPRLSL